MKYCLQKTKKGLRLLCLLFLSLTATAAFADVEPNNAIANATPLDLATEVTGTLNTEPAVDADDYYVIDLPDNGSLEATVAYSDGMTGFLYFYQPNGVQITNVPVNGTAVLNADCIGSGLIYVRVNSANTGNYTLSGAHISRAAGRHGAKQYAGHGAGNFCS